MANGEQLVRLREGVEAWNGWRSSVPGISVDLTEANLRGMDLRRVDLSHAYLGRVNLSEANLRDADFEGSNLNWADLREAEFCKARLTGTDLRNASVRGCNLSEVNLRGANLTGVDLSEVNLCDAGLQESRLVDANLQEANLRHADLSRANLQRANLGKARMVEGCLELADLRETNLTKTDLRAANLTGADLRSARLQEARLDRATMTGVKLWETQRSGWSIGEVVCGAALWDEKGEETVRYEPGEFVRLYSAQARVELVYEGGITPFEVNTLPALLHDLATRYPDRGVRLKSIEETGGGVRVSISVSETDAATLDLIRAEARQSQAAQIALRDDQIARLRIERELLLGDVLPRMLAAAGQTVQITGTATNLVIAGGQASVHARQTIHDGDAVRAMLREVLARRGELPLAAEAEAQLKEAARSVEEELDKSEPSRSMVAAGVGIVKEIVVKVVEGASEKALLEHWHPLLSGLTHFLSQAL